MVCSERLTYMCVMLSLISAQCEATTAFSSSMAYDWISVSGS